MEQHRYIKDDVRTVGTSGSWTREKVGDETTWTLATDGGGAVVKWKDGTLPDQEHPPAGKILKAGSKVIYNHTSKTYEIEELLEPAP